MMNFGAWGTTLLGWMSTIFFWILFILGLFILIIVVLKVRKHRKLKIPVIETIKLSEDKTAFLETVGGWFKTRSMFFGMYDYGGDDRFLVKDGREVQNVSTEDYQDINGHKGFVVRRKGDDPKVLVPITKVGFTEKTEKVLMDIAPVDMRDASTKILDQNEQEAASKFEKTLQLILPYFMIGFFIIAMILTFQYAKHTQAESWKNVLEAQKIVAGMKSNIIQSTAPLFLIFKRKIYGRIKGC